MQGTALLSLNRSLHDSPSPLLLEGLGGGLKFLFYLDLCEGLDDVAYLDIVEVHE